MTIIARTVSVDPELRFGKPVIEGTRVPVSVVVGAVAAGNSWEGILKGSLVIVEPGRLRIGRPVWAGDSHRAPERCLRRFASAHHGGAGQRAAGEGGKDPRRAPGRRQGRGMYQEAVASSQLLVERKVVKRAGLTSPPFLFWSAAACHRLKVGAGSAPGGGQIAAT